MKSLQLLRIAVIGLFFSVAVFAQDDPNPNSPTPVLLTGVDSSRILAVSAANFDGSNIPANGQIAFRSGSDIVIFVRDVALGQDEDYNAFRVYLTQQTGRTYELMPTAVTRLKKGVTALTVRLYDQSGYRGQPSAIGDSVFSVTWRGMVSNYLKIGIGKTGGKIDLPSPARTSGIQPEAPEFVGYRWSGDRIRFLEQATFGPSPADDDRIRRIGLRTWLAEQFDAPYPTSPMPNITQFPTNLPSDCTAATFPACYRDHYTMTPLQLWFFREAMYGNAQLRHRVAWALSQILVTSGVVTQQSSHAIAYHQILTDGAFGNYKELLRNVTVSPTMGNYLDMVRSTKANPNENYPREVLQLFSIGLFMLNQDGSLKLDNQGNPIPTYDQATINEFSKVFTGWSYNNTGPHATPGTLNFNDPMIVNPVNHDTTAKSLMSYPGATVTTVPACGACGTNGDVTAYADDSLNRAITNIFEHPNVGPYIGKLLIQHLVTSDPSPAYVARVAAAFNNNGGGIRGDMKAVVRAVLLDPEARGDVKTAPRYGKLREPAQFISNLTRIFPTTSFNGTTSSDGALSSWATSMGQNPFYSPTVFNYFPPDHIVAGTTILGPEFELLNTSLAVYRSNFLHVLIFDGIAPNASDSLRGTALDLTEYGDLSTQDATGNRLLDVLNNRMMHGTLSTAQRNAILPAVQAVPTTDPLRRARTEIYLLAASSQYQVQK